MFCLLREEIKEKDLSALRSSIDILISGLDVFVPFEFKDNLTDSTLRNTEETGDINDFIWKISQIKSKEKEWMLNRNAIAIAPYKWFFVTIF